MLHVAKISDTTRSAILQHHKDGKSRNEISRITGVSAGTVTNICKAAGLEFDRSATKSANEAKQTDNKARRLGIIDRLYGRCERILDRVENDVYRYTVTTKEGTEKVEDTEPPSGDERNHATAIGIYLDKALRLEQVDGSVSDLPAVDAWLEHMMGGKK